MKRKKMGDKEKKKNIVNSAQAQSTGSTRILFCKKNVKISSFYHFTGEYIVGIWFNMEHYILTIENGNMEKWQLVYLVIVIFKVNDTR